MYQLFANMYLNKIKFYLRLLSLAALFLSGSLSLHASGKDQPLVNEEIRLKAAREYLADQPNQLAIFTKGLVCSSCGIGLRIHLSRIKSIDPEKYQKGILIDATKQLIVVALKADAKPDLVALTKAIYKAGYEVGHFYQREQQAVAQTKAPEIN